ncbi:MAG TPA: DNA polymerase III subunit delta [Candidatus Saccharimonadales bacterium]|nr:DNA polymerase III subunit delta [Candidatus Saccharimonadales bacterium]
MVRVFVGPNSYALREAVKSARDKFMEKYGDLALEVIDGEESSYEHILMAIESVPFLAPKKMLIIYGLGNIKEAVENLDALIEAASENDELIIVEPKPDKRSSYFKNLKKNTQLTEFKDPDEGELAHWLVEHAKNRGAELSSADAAYLVQRIGGSQQRAANELNKLIDYGAVISRETIDYMTEASPQTSVFNLLDAAFGGNAGKAIKIYEEQRTQGEEPIKIMAMLIWQMHLVALVDSAGGRTDQEIMAASGLKPFTLNKSKSIARKMGRQRIKAALSRLVELDRQLKSTSIDADDALKDLLISIS